MIVDSSALIAILMGEPEQDRLLVVLTGDPDPVMSAATFTETSIVAMTRPVPQGLNDLDALIALAGIRIVPVTHAQALLAREAFRRFGKGRHPAALNFGDCFTYALAQDRGEDILCKSADFARTDARVALI